MNRYTSYMRAPAIREHRASSHPIGGIAAIPAAKRGAAAPGPLLRAANPALAEILDYTSDEVIGRSYVNFVISEGVHLVADA